MLCERGALAATLGIFAAALAAGAAWAYRRYSAGTYLRFETMFGKARVYQVADDEGEAVRLLEVGGIVQSGTYLEERYTELVFEYLKRYDELFELNPAAKSICVLGCGGYDYPEHLIANHPDTIVDAVEIDPAITAIARRYFYLDRLIEEYETEQTGRLSLVCADALEHLQACGKRYDAIVNDTFDAGEPPEHLTTRAFAQAVRDCLAPGGMYLTNIVSALEGPGAQFLNEQVALLESVFDDVEVLPCDKDSVSVQDNVIVIAR
jgi:spermidine synthase